MPIQVWIQHLVFLILHLPHQYLDFALSPTPSDQLIHNKVLIINVNFILIYQEISEVHTTVIGINMEWWHAMERLQAQRDELEGKTMERVLEQSFKIMQYK